MVLALALVSVLANVSAIERFWLIAKALRRRDLKPRENASTNETKPKQTSEAEVTHPADIGL
jgi:hypothetical protein